MSATNHNSQCEAEGCTGAPAYRIDTRLVEEATGTVALVLTGTGALCAEHAMELLREATAVAFVRGEPPPAGKMPDW